MQSVNDKQTNESESADADGPNVTNSLMNSEKLQFTYVYRETQDGTEIRVAGKFMLMPPTKNLASWFYILNANTRNIPRFEDLKRVEFTFEDNLVFINVYQSWNGEAL